MDDSDLKFVQKLQFSDNGARDTYNGLLANDFSFRNSLYLLPKGLVLLLKLISAYQVSVYKRSNAACKQSFPDFYSSVSKGARADVHGRCTVLNYSYVDFVKVKVQLSLLCKRLFISNIRYFV